MRPNVGFITGGRMPNQLLMRISEKRLKSSGTNLRKCLVPIMSRAMPLRARL